MTAAAVHLAPNPTPRPRSRTTTVIPDSHPSTPHVSRKVAATLVLGTPALAAIWGSATALTAIAGEDKVTSPWTLPFCLDVLALGMVVVALLVPGRSFIRRVTPWVCYLFSAGLQVAEAWNLGPRAWGTHAAGLVAAAVGSHVILDLWAPDPSSGVTRAANTPSEVVAEPIEATPEPESVKPAALASVTPVVRPAPARKPASKPTAPAPDPAVLARVRAALDELGLSAHDVTRDQILEHLRPGAPHATKVGAALRHLKEQS